MLGPKLPLVEHDLDSHVHHVASISGSSQSIWAKLQPNITNWLHLGLKLGPRKRKLGPSWPSWALFGGSPGPS